MKLLFCVMISTFAILMAGAQTEPQTAAVEVAVLESPERLTAAQLKALSLPRLDSKPKGKDRVSANAGAASPVQSQIINGQRVARGSCPWVVAVIQDNAWFCGGSLISGQWVLTAAHCALGRTNFVVVLGAQTRNVFENGRVTLETTDKFVHPDYNAANINNDVALLRLPVVLATPTSVVNLIRLPKTSQASTTFVGFNTTVCGWGLTKEGGSVSQVLSNATMGVISNANCAAVFGSTYVVSSTICTSGADKKNTCSGDSGGPLVIKEADGRFTQIGVVSFGAAKACTKGYPAAYARVTSFLGWISTTSGIALP